MKQSEYLDYMKTHPNWRPGWEAIAEQFETVYGPGSLHFLDKRAVPDACKHLDGFGVASSSKGYLHIVTCGLTNIAANIDAYGCVRSGWGYELTVKWPGNSIEACHDAFLLLGRLANYMQVKRTWFSERQTVSLKLLSFAQGQWPDTFAGVLFVPDTEIPMAPTVHGSVEFRQVTNLTFDEIKKLKKHNALSVQLVFNLLKQYPDLQIDLSRRSNSLPD
ncbi:MAG: suppressor of fused domain protein [Oscillospiraceae bacterium]|nr:suppressor of fused domain protein [Oscillospiraceae bacterium]